MYSWGWSQGTRSIDRRSRSSARENDDVSRRRRRGSGSVAPRSFAKAISTARLHDAHQKPLGPAVLIRFDLYVLPFESTGASLDRHGFAPFDLETGWLE